MECILEEDIVFTTFNNKYIIKCKCLDILISKKIYDSKYAFYYCNKVKVIEIYDNNKNTDSINVPEYKYLLEKDSIISSEELNKEFKKNIYFKTFLRAIMNINKINNIKYFIKNNGEIYGFKNNIIHLNGFMDIFKLKELNYSTIFFCKNKPKYFLHENIMGFCMIYYLHNNIYKYYVNNYYNKINITRSLKEKKNFYEQTIICDKELKILQLLERDFDKIIYKENRDDNGKIINIKEYNPKTNKLDIIYSNDGSFLIKSKKTFSQRLINFYKLNIKHDLCKLISLKNKELQKAKINLLSKIFEQNLV